MRRSWWLLTLAVVALAAGPATRPATAPTSKPAKPPAEFVSGEYGLTVKYPADWVVPEHPIDGQLFSVRTPALPATRPTTVAAGAAAAATKPADRFGTAGLRVVSQPNAADDAAVLKDVSAALVTYVVNHGGQHVTLKPDDTAAFPARRVRFETPGAQGTPTSVMTVVIVHGRTAYVFAFAAPTDAFDTLKPDFDAIVKAFVVDE